MWAQSQVALKEWAALCALTGAGRHSVLLRKGGIREPRLTVEHRAFWLLPTYFHAREPGRERDLAADARALLPEVLASAPPAGSLRIDLFAEVDAAYHVRERERLHALAGAHGLAPALAGERFDYREPGLWVLVLRTYRLSQPILLPDRPGYAGCVSWVHLDEALAGEASPALTDDEHAARAAAVRAALGVA